MLMQTNSLPKKNQTYYKKHKRKQNRHKRKVYGMNDSMFSGKNICISLYRDPETTTKTFKKREEKPQL